MQANRRVMRRRLRHEPLEERRMLATVTWDGGGDGRSWGNPTNWDNNVLPTSDDEVVIGRIVHPGSNLPGFVRVDSTGRYALSTDLSVRSIQSASQIGLSDVHLTLTTGDSQFSDLRLNNSSLTFTAGNSTYEGDELWLESSVLAVEGESTSFTGRPQGMFGHNGTLKVTAGAEATLFGRSINYDIQVIDAAAFFPDAQAVNDIHVREQGIVSAPFVSIMGHGSSVRADSGSTIVLGTSVPATETDGFALQLFVGEDSSFISGQLIVDGFISGSGVIVGDVQIERGDLYATNLKIDGSLELSASSNTRFTVSPESAPLQVTGTTTLGGRLSVEVGEAFVPIIGSMIGSSISIVSSATVLGQFQLTSVNARNSGVTFDVSQSLNSIDVTVVADPGLGVPRIDVSDENEALEYIDVLFDQGVNQVRGILRLPSGELVEMGRRGGGLRTGPNSRRFLPRIGGAGEYEFSLIDVFNVNGNGIDLDGDGVRAEPVDDTFTTTFVISDDSAPQVKSVQIGSISQGPITDFFVTFTELIVNSSFDSTDLVIRDEDGQVVDVGTRVMPHAYEESGHEGVDRSTVDDTFRVFLEGQLPPGTMTLEIGPFIEDINGHLLNQDGDEIFGEDGDRFETDLTRPLPLPLGSLNEHGAFVEAFISPGEFREITPSFLGRLTPDITGIAETIDFTTEDNRFFTQFDPLSLFLGPAFQVDEEHASVLAHSFRMRSSFNLAIREELDLNPATPEIDIRIGRQSDDGFWLSVGGQFISRDGDGARASSFPLSFSTAGVYPVDLLYYANDGGSSGLQTRWDTAIAGETVIPSNEIYLDTSRILPGDVNGNGRVDSTDLGRLLNNFGDESPELGWVDGDLNGDDVVDSIDLGEVLNNFGLSQRTLALLNGEDEEEDDKADSAALGFRF